MPTLAALCGASRSATHHEPYDALYQELHRRSRCLLITACRVISTTCIFSLDKQGDWWLLFSSYTQITYERFWCHGASKYGGIVSRPNVRASIALFRLHTARK